MELATTTDSKFNITGVFNQLENLIWADAYA